MYTNKTKQYILPIILLAGFATGCECSNKEEPASGTPDTSATPGNNTQTPPPSSPQYALQLIDLQPGGILGDTNKCRIVITKTENGTVTTIDAAELGNLTLTATSDINDGTQATLQGVDPLKLDNSHIRPGTIEKEVIIKRGTAETRLTITLTYTSTTVVTSTATVVVAPALVFDLSITLKGGQKPVLTGASQRQFEVEITSKQADIEVNKLSDITLEYTSDDPNSSFFAETKKFAFFGLQSGMTTLREILQANNVNKLQKGVPSTLQFCLRENNPSTKLTNIKLKGTLDPGNPANYIKEITYNKPDVTLRVTQPAKGKRNFKLTITTTTPLNQDDLEYLFIEYDANPVNSQLACNTVNRLRSASLSQVFPTGSLAAGSHDIPCDISGLLDDKNPPHFSKLRIVGSAQEATNQLTVTYTPK